ncbi:hypothetical protein WRSd3_p00136 (plasmid) [Shigella dysenteriae WRSd3]|uniref:Uncharacterized protein n=1 Tax=Shigella dysenteriae WRSd3 TaxID=1401327 RepID=A0A090N9K1_SHIDY|nr:hypothetical protein WRSd3_p00136 [Shigella dysenteriae WRSd3]
MTSRSRQAAYSKHPKRTERAGIRI